MPVELMQANPLVEEVKNQVAVKRGPIVYCLESDQLPANTSINEVVLNANSVFTTNFIQVNNRQLLTINATSLIDQDNSWDKKLYQPVSAKKSAVYKLTLIPYFAWGNHGAAEMTVWMPH
jgi:DUF1680 family protein